MTSDKANLPAPPPKPRYRWPWFVLGAVVLAIVLAVLWMSKEIERTRRIRDLNAPPAGARTSTGAVGPGAFWQPGQLLGRST